MEKKANRKKYYRSVLIKTGLFALVMFVTFGVILNLKIYHGTNMYPGVRDGDLMVSLRLNKYFGNDDVVVYGNGKVGRIVAQPGDTVDINDEGVIKINGYIPAETIPYKTVKAEEGISYPYTVPEGSVFVLNDFRNDTDDSRENEAIAKNKIRGKLIFLIRRRGF